MNMRFDPIFILRFNGKITSITCHQLRFVRWEEENPGQTFRFQQRMDENIDLFSYQTTSDFSRAGLFGKSNCVPG